MTTYPDYVQVNYQRTMSDGLPGTLADANPAYIDSFIAQSEDIKFGTVVSVGSNATEPKSAVKGGGTIPATAGTLAAVYAPAELAQFISAGAGTMSVSVDGTSKTITIAEDDFANVDDYSDVAAVLNTKLTGATFAYNAVVNCFVITSATTGASSSVTGASDTAGDVFHLLGFDGNAIATAGKASYVAKILGVVVRSVTVEGGPNRQSATPLILEGDVGAVLVDGSIKAMANEDAVAGGDVYFDNTTGYIYASTTSGRTKLGTAKFKYACKAGEVAVIDVTGLR